MATTATFDTTERSRPRDADVDSGVDIERLSVEEMEGTTVLPKDLVFELLSVDRRRSVLEHVDECGDEIPVDEVAEHITTKERETTDGREFEDHRERVSISLYQCHLPKLDDANVIDFDRASGTIELRQEAQQLFPYMSLDPFKAVENDSRDERTDVNPLSALTTKLKNRVLN